MRATNSWTTLEDGISHDAVHKNAGQVSWHLPGLTAGVSHDAEHWEVVSPNNSATVGPGEVGVSVEDVELTSVIGTVQAV